MSWSKAGCAVALALVATPAAAQTRPGFEVGALGFDYAYRERVDGRTVVRDDGVFGGLSASYVETLGDRLFLRARFDASAGEVDYRADDGSRLENVEQSIGQLELQFGGDLRLGGRTTLSPFVGLGARVLTDESGGKETSDGLLGYDREISYAYVPVGATLSLRVGRRAGLRLSGQYNHLVDGEARSDLSQVDPALPDLRLALNGGSGIEASAMLALPLGRDEIAFGPFLRRWSIDRSESRVLVAEGEEGELFEPRNRTTETGLRISFAF